MEGLAYLTLDADVKDDFVQDEPAMQAMFELAKVRNLRRAWFAINPCSLDPGEAILIHQGCHMERALTFEMPGGI